ncbi:zinc ribbon domain-containing protein [Butyrivibrio sp. MC2021]|uniref:zinc ribbon domain-containing protein n=1 Tax=Butyrivibrio sp. MC2021 TaxID=1408306 RepID=UPI00068716DA|nr:hypothetical protein [Butyrivibrio sp. MC2021]
MPPENAKNNLSGLWKIVYHLQMAIDPGMLIFADMLCYKLAEYGLRFALTEESYTSKADFLAMDPIPMYEKGKNKEYSFSGRRIKRGLYRHYDGTLTNADINGAANILRKVFPKVTQYEGHSGHALFFRMP